MYRGFEWLLNIIYPPRCIFCTKIMHFLTDIEVCEKCACNLPFKNKNKVLYKKLDNKYIDHIICLFEYEGIVKKMLHDYKFKGKIYHGRKMSKIIIKYTKIVTNFDKFDIIISVPLHRQRLRERGYNQSEILSKNLSRINNLDDMSGYFIRSKNTQSQVNLKMHERENNVRGAFELLNDSLVYGANIILIDDIFTTGSTMTECAKVLKEAGAKSVTALVIASGNKF